MQKVFYAALVLLAVALVMSLPMHILVPIVAISVALYLYYDVKKQSFNKKLIAALKMSVDSTENKEIAESFNEIIRLRSKDRFIETVFVGAARDRLLPDALKDDLPTKYSVEELSEYLLENAGQLAQGETYEELERTILRIKEGLNT